MHSNNCVKRQLCSCQRFSACGLLNEVAGTCSFPHVAHAPTRCIIDSLASSSQGAHSMVVKPAPLTVLACVANAYLVSCQFFDYNGHDLDEYEMYEHGYDAVEHNAVGSKYFEPYIGEYDETYGDSFVRKTPHVKDCQIGLDGSPSFNGVHQASQRCQTMRALLNASRLSISFALRLAGTKPCDLQIQGVDKVAPLLPGGMDGAYKLVTCANGRPLYKRITTDKAGDQQLVCCLIIASASSDAVQAHSAATHSCRRMHCDSPRHE